MVTLSDVARAAGVSLSTASRAINGSRDRTVKPHLRDRVLVAAAELNYSANATAQAMARGRTTTIGLMVHDITDPYFSGIAAGVTRAARDRGCVVTLATTDRQLSEQLTIIDVLARVELLDGRSLTMIARPSRPFVEITAAQSGWEVAGAYIVEGIRHILFGADHLLFVLGLLLIVGNVGTLIKTVTAFTVAHSITLATATLGYVQMPPLLPLNAAVALSILFLAPEIVRVWRGQTSFTLRHPWVVANDRLVAAGWKETSSNEEAYVLGHEASAIESISPQRRQELALGVAGAVGVAAAVAAGALIRRRRRRRRSA